MPCWKSCCLFIFLLCLAVSVSAQQANFTADKTSGCSPLTISFTNTSTGFSNATTYSWDFGNTNSSILENPGTTYNDAGNYTVILTVSDGSKRSTKTIQVTVYKKPVADFSIDVTQGCAPLEVTFTSNSQPGDGSISTYTWDFGDGIAQTGTSPQVHTYTIGKSIRPSLTVTNSYGCISPLSKPQLITVLPQVIASFKTNKTVLCKVGDAANFINTSAGVGTLTYHWDFGDGDTSAVQQPKHVYKQRGIYTVKLTATSPDGCTSDTTLVNNLNVADYHTSFTVPPVICQNTQALFADSSTPVATTEQWLINGTPSNDTASHQLQHTFSAPGSYKIRLVNVYEACPDTATKTIIIQQSPTTGGFTAQPQGSCGAPVTVNFTDTSKNAIGWQWNFGDGTASGQTASHLYNANGTYNVTLTATSANGCTAQTTQPVTVQKATVSISSSAGSLGCQTKTTSFFAVTNDTIVSYNWNFGDGSSSSQASPKHTFTAPGTYDVVLSYTTKGGCSDTTNYIINVYQKPQFNFTASVNPVCGSNPVLFTVTGSNLVGTFTWNFGDGIEYDSLPPPFSHRYQSDSVYTVSLIISNNGCADTAIKTNYVTVLPPFPHITSAANTCDGTRGLATFTEASAKVQQYSWNFGDSSAPYVYNSAQEPIQHVYKATGAYHISLTTTNGACSAKDSVDINVLLKQHTVLSAQTNKFCSSDTLHTTLSKFEGNPFTYPASLGYTITTLQYGDGNTFTGNANTIENTTQNSFGINLNNINVYEDSLRVITTSQNFGCQDTSNYISFEALGPVANFSLKENTLCFKTPVVFIDESKPSHNSPIIKWQWNFGDSAMQTTIQSTSVSHRYAKPGTYQAMLTVTDANSCTSSTPLDSNSVTITGPVAAFTISQNPVLPAINVSFYNQTDSTNTNGYDNVYTWNFGDGNTIKNQPFTDSVLHIYKKESIDTVVLIAANAVEHCADTASQILYVQNPNLSFTYTTVYINPNSGCPPVIASFVNTSINTTNVSWSFGDSATASNLNNASHIYNKPGIYKVTLYGYFIDGTTDSVFQWITIKGPFATLKAVKPFACGAEPITLQAVGSNTKQFAWDFGDGTLINNNDTLASHRYLTPGVYTPSLIVKDSNNCQFPFFLTQPIIIDTLHLNINTNAQVTCDSSFILFTPTIVSEAKTLGLPLTYHWSFGTGVYKDTANTQSSSFVYNKPGKYEVILSGSSQFGCTDITRDTINIQPTPYAYIAGPAQICEGDSASFTGVSTEAVTWSWQFPNGDTSTLQKTTTKIFATPGLDSISLIVNDKGCYDTTWHWVTVNAKPVINPSPLSAHLCEGDSVQLQAHDGNVFTWTPKQHISGSTTATPYVFPDTATTYFVQVKNEANCVSNDSVSITVTQRFTTTALSPVYICPGGIAQLNASGAYKYQWLNNNVSNTAIANPTVSTYSSQAYTVVGFDSAGCFADTANAQVLTATLPTVNAGTDITAFAGTPVTLSATGSNDIIQWQWIPDIYLNCDTCQTITVIPHANVQYIVKATSNKGCINYDTLQVAILCKGSLINVPSAFTPNGDGKNERFTILGRGIKEVKHFAVFNRLGEVLYEKEHFSVNETAFEGWDGTYKNVPAPPGTYVYFAEIVCDTGELFHYKGTVVLIR